MLSREEVARRVMRLPEHERRLAADLALRLYGPATAAPGGRSQAAREPKQRRRYAGDPWAYFADVFGVRLSPQQEDALALIERETRVLLPSANNMGKTFLLGGHAVYTLDAVAAQPDEEMDLPEQGARILLPGPDAATIFATVYSEMLALAARAEARGHLMPGRRSENSVLWRVRAQWEVEAFNPPPRVHQAVAHTASGRHHRNQNAYIEEGQGVAEPTWKATEGMCSSAGNKIASSFNPTEAVGPAFQRSTGSTYVTQHLDAFDHPNVLQRAPVIPAAVDHRVIDGRVRDECSDRGPYPEAVPDPDKDDFLYALPPRGAEERGGREDGVRGHPDAEIRVFRPQPAFVAQVRGQYPKTAGGGLFDAGTWDAGVARWRAGRDPDSPADRVGLDPAEEGGDNAAAAPSWGRDAGALLRAYLDVERDLARLERLRDEGRTRVGTVRFLPKGDGWEVAEAAFAAYGHVPYNIDDGGVGSSPRDWLRRALGCDVADVSFAESAPEPVRLWWEPWLDNMRASLYWRAARVVQLGLVDPPDDPLLREEVMAHTLKSSSRVVEFREPGTGRPVKKRVQSWLLAPKDQIKAKIGRSPDRSDAFVLSLFGAPAQAQAVIPVAVPIGIANVNTTFRLG